ncbi:hypothetical protein RRG08_053629 [Elysia crispata]|uniref:Uncharacterized protein n=1 Tax=Elysia crispata TaxID=231223 RepID=A0AAE0Y1U1_9GAST|nr:hypothetical protein RRG08_053629 [Elysia crispata]
MNDDDDVIVTETCEPRSLLRDDKSERYGTNNSLLSAISRPQRKKSRIPETQYKRSHTSWLRHTAQDYSLEAACSASTEWAEDLWRKQASSKVSCWAYTNLHTVGTRGFLGLDRSPRGSSEKVLQVGNKVLQVDNNVLQVLQFPLTRTIKLMVFGAEVSLTRTIKLMIFGAEVSADQDHQTDGFLRESHTSSVLRLASPPAVQEEEPS